MSRKTPLLFVVLIAAASLLLAACSGAASQQDEEIRVGVIMPLTGLAAAVGPEVQMGVEFAFEQVDNQIAGRDVVLIFEDETDDPTNAVARARKLVEEDGVDVILGPQLAHTAAAVSAYAAEAGVPHIGFGASDTPTSDHTFYPGSGRGDAYATGLFAYEDLEARTAAVLYQDYLFGQQSRDGFVAAFTDQGGEIISEQAVPFGTPDMAPFLEGIGDADVIAVLLLNPSDFAFVRQYREFGLDQPVLFISNAPQEAPLLAEMGDAVVGMYGSSWYSPLIESEANGEFVGAFSERYGRPPGMAVHVAYSAASFFIEAAQAANGDTSPEALTAALVGLDEVTNPAGTVSIGADRGATHDHYLFQGGKQGEFYVWEVAKKYEAVEPR
ncbi:MAG: ABC transporter substrate-binding protein [Chloroflexi bacterium]|nr:ABC transporter substrate-binding protein [Chloroflexota bacterium]